MPRHDCLPGLLRSLCLFVAGFGLLAGSAANASAQNAIGREGLYLPVHSPITTEVFEWIKLRIDSSRKSTTNPPSIIVLDFNPGEKDANTPSFGACGDLANYLATLTDIQTVAFVHGKVTGFTVFPALMCSELIMSSASSIGEMVRPDGPLKEVEESALKILLTPRRGGQIAAIRKMSDPNIELVRGRDAKGGEILLEKNAAVPAGVTVTNPVPLNFAPRGKIGLFTAKQARDLGLCRSIVENRSDLAELYRVSPASLRMPEIADRPSLAFKYVLHGTIDAGKRESLTRTLRDVVKQKATIVFLQLECGGGNLDAARDLAAELQKFQAGEPTSEDAIRIVAFIPDKAPDTATVIALGCTHIVMRRGKGGPDAPPESTIGNFDAFLGKGKGKVDAQEAIASSLIELAKQQGHNPLLVQGMVDRDVVLYRVRNTRDATNTRIMTAEQFEAEKADWVQEKLIKPAGQLLELTATDAEQLRLIHFTVDSRDLADVATRYGIEPGKIREATPGPIDQFATFLRIPAVTVLLVVIGFAGLILELKVPGTTVPGIIAALAFILLFWAHTQFSGQIAVLAGAIFLLGLVLILLEVFVIPGFGATGILGILFMLAGLALATMDKIPTSATEWGVFGSRAAQYLFGMIGSVGLAFLVAKFLPRIPYANRMMLIPPSEKVDPITEMKESVPGAAQAMALIGAVGTAVTVLRPAGNVRFGDEFVDVVADGGYIPAGARVRVVLVEGNRIVVKEV